MVAGSGNVAFQRGDVDADSSVNLADPLSLLNHLFLRASEPPCQKAADANDDGRLNLADAIGILLHLFQDGGPLPEPTGCGLDPTDDKLTCESSPGCRSAAQR